ncbi:hypothetical protein EDD11_010412, partial [Mortierella claussenii]
MSVEIEAAVALQTRHAEKIYADILDNARYLTHFHLAPPLEPLKLERGKLAKTVKQPPSLLIRCDTGGGKTVFTEAVVKADPKSKFVVITPRRTHADMMEERLTNVLEKRSEFRNYQDIPPGVIASESQYKLDLKFYCEGDTILILDELSSLIKQMCSDKTHGNMHNLNLQMFERLIRRPTRVIGLDADLSNEEIEIMKSLRSDFCVINNMFQQQKDDKVVLFDSKWKLIEKALELLRAGCDIFTYKMS